MTCDWSKEFCSICFVEECHLKIFADGHKVGPVFAKPFGVHLEMLKNH